MVVILICFCHKMDPFYYLNILDNFPTYTFSTKNIDYVVVSSIEMYHKYSNYPRICPEAYEENCFVMPTKNPKPRISLKFSKKEYPYIIPLENYFDIRYSSINSLDEFLIPDIKKMKKTGVISYLDKPVKNNNFVVIVPSYNCSEYLEICLKSIESQTYTNYKVCLIDDGSTCQKHSDICKLYSEKNNWTLVLNNINKKSLHNIVNAINIMQLDDQDIIVLLDGDDYIFSKTLEILNYHYQDETMITFGTYIYDSDTHKLPHYKSPKQFSIKEITYENIRRVPWIFSHLRSFKSHLWNRIDNRDLKYRNKYYPVSWDLAFMYPLLELGFKYMKHVTYPIYAYNVKTSNNDFKQQPDLQYSLGIKIKQGRKYPSIE